MKEEYVIGGVICTILALLFWVIKLSVLNSTPISTAKMQVIQASITDTGEEYLIEDTEGRIFYIDCARGHFEVGDQIEFVKVKK